MVNTDNYPLVSLILVVYNEREYIEDCLKSYLEQTYPVKQIEIILVDSGSTDGTREYLAEKVKELDGLGKKIKLIDNPKKILSSGWNLAIKSASGSIVCRIDGHSTIAPDYVKIGVNELLRHKDKKVLAVGGWLTNAGRGISGEAIARMSSCRFAVGNTPNRFAPKETTFTDIVCYGLYWKHVIEEIGFFDENLARNQDVELLSRTRKSGFRTMTHPDMKAKYFVRNSFNKLIKKAFNDGYWVILSKRSYLRHKIPLFFVFYILSFLTLWTMAHLNIFIKMEYFFYFSLPIVSYGLLSIFFSIKNGGLYYCFYLFFLFFGFHVSYGIGSLCGIVNNLRWGKYAE